MPGVILRTVMENDWILRDLGRAMSRVVRENLKATAEFWHRELLAGHFRPSNRARFQHQARTTFTKTVTKRVKGVGQGKFVDNVLKGQSQRFMKAFANITGTRRQAVLTMRPPAYFTRPFRGSFRDARTGQTKTITQQPDKPGEITAIDQADRKRIEEFAAADLKQRIREEQQRNKVSTTL